MDVWIKTSPPLQTWDGPLTEGLQGSMRLHRPWFTEFCHIVALSWFHCKHSDQKWKNTPDVCYLNNKGL